VKRLNPLRLLRALPGWERGAWRGFYIVILCLLAYAPTQKDGPGAIPGLVITFVIGMAIAAVRTRWRPQWRPRRRGNVKLGFRMHGRALFPNATTTLVEDEVWPPWPEVLRKLHEDGETFLVLPANERFASQFGVEARVLEEDGLFTFEGLWRVRVVKTSPIPAGYRQSLERSLQSQGLHPGFAAQNVVECTYVTVVEEDDSSDAQFAEPLKREFARWALTHPDGKALRRAVDAQTTPAGVADAVSQALWGFDPEYAAGMLKTADVHYRLLACRATIDRLLRPPPLDERGTASQPPPAEFPVTEPDELETLSDVGGMSELKEQIRGTIGFLLENQELATRMQLSVNGVLLYGPPGNGKTLVARATAGEYQLRFLSVSGGDISADGLMGVAENKIRSAFRTAADNAPCLLFFDEFDSIAGRRDAGGGNAQYQAQIVGTLLRGIEEIRKTPGVIVMAATNDVDALDPALIRAGRFDERIHVGVPDADARRSIFETKLADLPTAGDIQLDRLVAETEGRSGADIASLVEDAKVRAIKRAVGGPGTGVALGQADLEEALSARRGKDAPTLEPVSWDDVILPDEKKQELRTLTDLVVDPNVGRLPGMRRPTGAILYGPPGTGKTLIARAIASNARGRLSFIQLKGSDITSKWVGESEANLRQAFERARSQSPCVLFIDEIEALFPKRSDSGDGDVQRMREALLTEFLQQVDGLDTVPGVFVLGATNHLDKLDPAVVRGGRLGRLVEIPLPTVEGREALLRLHARDLSLAPDVDLAAVARLTEGASGADLEAICQSAVEAAYERDEATQQVTQADFLKVLERRRASVPVDDLSWDDLVLPDATLADLKGLARLIANPEAGRRFGLKPPTGALLYGPPGTGKTTIARVIASQLRGDVSFIQATGSDIVGRYVGDSAARMRGLFERARRQPPAILFIDEIEAVLPSRDMGIDAERGSVVTEFLNQVDGLQTAPGVFVLGATNLAERIDPAALRPGRLSRQIAVPLPTQANRMQLFQRHLAGIALDGEVDLERLAEATEGASGAEIAGICNGAAEHAFLREARATSEADLMVALDRWRESRVPAGHGATPGGFVGG
jgi:transitional endoplasmic reticulum ATPase